MNPTANETHDLDWPEPGIARITFNRGDQMNTLTFQMIAELGATLARLHAAPPRVLILTGSGRTFCGGAHVTYFTEPDSPLAGNPHALREQYVRPILAAFDAITRLPCPTVAAINGHALGGGMELALACDFRLAASGIKLGLPEARLGALAGANGVQQLHRIVGRAKALEVLMLAEHLSPEQARTLGLVTAVHPGADLAEAALSFARRFLKLSPISLAETKRAVYRTESMPTAAAHEVALDAVQIAAAGPEWAEGMRAFRERREPAFASAAPADDPAR